MSEEPSYFQNPDFMRACLDERADDVREMAKTVSSSDIQWGVFLSIQSGKMATLNILSDYFDFDVHDNLMLYHACNLSDEVFEFVYTRSTPHLALAHFKPDSILPANEPAKERLLTRIKADEERDILNNSVGSVQQSKKTSKI